MTDPAIYSGRKIILAAILLLVALVVTYTKGDIPSNLLSFMEVLFGTFVIGNATEHVSNAVINNRKDN